MSKTPEEKRKKLYIVIEHLNASVNVLRAIGMTEVADDIKDIIREINKK